jgi:hypothetical protein
MDSIMKNDYKNKTREIFKTHTSLFIARLKQHNYNSAECTKQERCSKRPWGLSQNTKIFINSTRIGAIKFEFSYHVVKRFSSHTLHFKKKLPGCQLTKNEQQSTENDY